MKIDDSTTKNTRLFDGEFTPKTEHLDLNFWSNKKCDSHKFDYTTVITVILIL